ncbi:hypothetical protein EMIT0P44_200030 [Pseudomonas sp. IT-P44]|jgi:hypothetical protein
MLDRFREQSSVDRLLLQKKADRAAGLARHSSLQTRRAFHFSARIMPTFPACKKNYTRL